MTIKRPEVTPEITYQAALKTARVVDNIEVDEVIPLAEAIAKHYRGSMNGYDLARELDNALEWDDIDSSFVEAMDLMGMFVRREHDAVCKKWVEEENIQPPLPIGSVIQQGEITGISDHMPAHFEVKEPGQDDENGKRRLLIAFEKAEAA